MRVMPWEGSGRYSPGPGMVKLLEKWFYQELRPLMAICSLNPPGILAIVSENQVKSPESSKNAKRAKPVRPQKKPLSIEELHRQMMVRGLITRLPDPALDIDDDDPDDQPVLIEGEPLSETIIRERR